MRQSTRQKERVCTLRDAAMTLSWNSSTVSFAFCAAPASQLDGKVETCLLFRYF